MKTLLSKEGSLASRKHYSPPEISLISVPSEGVLASSSEIGDKNLESGLETPENGDLENITF